MKAWKQSVSKIQSVGIFLIFQTSEFLEVTKNNYTEILENYFKKYEIMFLSVAAVLVAGQLYLNCEEPKKQQTSATKVIYVFLIILEHWCLVHPHGGSEWTSFTKSNWLLFKCLSSGWKW